MNVNHDDMKNILFVQDPGEYRLLDSYMGYIPKVSDKEDYYYKQFSNMETALAKLQSQTSSISSMLGS